MPRILRFIRGNRSLPQEGRGQPLGIVGHLQNRRTNLPDKIHEFGAQGSVGATDFFKYHRRNEGVDAAFTTALKEHKGVRLIIRRVFRKREAPYTRFNVNRQPAHNVILTPKGSLDDYRLPILKLCPYLLSSGVETIVYAR